MFVEVSVITQRQGQVTSAYCCSPDLISRTLVFDDLKSHISEAAMHNPLAHYPPPLCHPKTRENVLKIITDWIDDSYLCQRIMWLNGPAGAGKSAIAQTIAERYKDSRVAASFFFLRNTPDRGVADRLFTTLAWQLGASIPETLPHIELALKTDPLLHTKSIDIQFDHLVVKVFENLLRDNPGLRPEKSLVLIDGVDECATDQDQKLLLTLITDALACTKIPLSFLICSRPEPHIKETFDTENMKRVSCAVVLDEEFAPDNDIRRFLEDSIFDIYTKHNIPRLPSVTDIDHLVSEASGQFVYASTVIKFIDDDDCNPKEQLDIVLELHSANTSSPYAQLDRLYIQILSQQPDVRFLRDVFVLIIARGDPSFKFICRRLRISEENLLLKLRGIHSLLQISDSCITVHHRSLHDFFQDKKRAGRYYIHPVRVAFVQLPVERLQVRRHLESVVHLFRMGWEGIVAVCLYPARMLMAPLFVMPGLQYYRHWEGETPATLSGCIYITFFYPFPTFWPVPANALPPRW